MQYIIGNWKMNGLRDEGLALAGALATHMTSEKPEGREVVLCPPATLIPLLAAAVFGSGIRTGGQDCHAAEKGAYTGDISAAMLQDMACEYVIVGHSERREHHGETSEQICEKARAALKHKLTPVVCVGEALAEREAGKAEEWVKEQVRASVPPDAAPADFIVAYEPIWAIGSGKTATTEDIAAMHRMIREAVAAHCTCPGEAVRIVYGGSVKPDNASEILKTQGVDGVLVGGASLEAESFWEIVTS